MEGQTELNTYRELIDARLKELLPPMDREPHVLHEAMRYSCLAPGKRLRPAMCMASAMACGGDPEEAIDAGCALEMFHCFSLIHDDLPAIDNDDLRRGRPTCHKVYGEAIAILTGDALFALSFRTISRCHWDSVRCLQAARILADAAGTPGVVGGEVLDLAAEGVDVTAAELEAIHRWKTGALIAASCSIGASVAGAESFVTDLYHFGMHVGLAFQIADDVLNETSTVEKLGKAIGSDRDRRKATYPQLHGLVQSREMAIAELERGLRYIEEVPGDARLLRNLANFAIERLH